MHLEVIHRMNVEIRSKEDLGRLKLSNTSKKILMFGLKIGAVASKRRTVVTTILLNLLSLTFLTNEDV